MEVVLFVGVALVLLLRKPAVFEFLGDIFPIVYKTAAVARKPVAIGGAVVETAGALIR